jgi:hypothetical protein
LVLVPLRNNGYAEREFMLRARIQLINTVNTTPRPIEVKADS